jgi:hypothetical protein
MAAPIRVLSIPAGHVYVQHLAHPDVPGVRRIDDPPVSPTAPAAQWWPPPALDARWLRRHAGDFDLVHLHFGFDGQSPAQLREMAGTLAELGKPFVYTVHDLRNPHHDTHTLHDEQLDVLVPAADRLITLTPGAAEEIKDRWGRDALVLPHPHVVDEPTLSAPRHARDEFVVGIHLKSLRASMDPGVVSAVGEVVADLPGARLQVTATPGTLTISNHRMNWTRRSSPPSKVPAQPSAQVYRPELAAMVEHQIENALPVRRWTPGRR